MGRTPSQQRFPSYLWVEKIELPEFSKEWRTPRTKLNSDNSDLHLSHLPFARSARER
jgi:hypothetical protein